MFTAHDLFSVTGSNHSARSYARLSEALERLHTDFGVPPVLMRVNNRRLAEGFYRGLGIDDHLAVLQRVDKLDKIGPDAVDSPMAGRRVRRLTTVSGTIRLARISSARATLHIVLSTH